jgi:hypothetical protein
MPAPAPEPCCAPSRRRRIGAGRNPEVDRSVDLEPGTQPKAPLKGNIKVLQRLMGHKTATMTLDRYGHLFPDGLGRIADAFDAFDAAADDLRTVPPLKAALSDEK